MKVKSESEVTESCPTLGDPMNCSPPGSSTHGIFQARVLEWGAIAFSEVTSKEQIHSSHQCVCSVVSDSQRPHGLQRTRLFRPQDFPGKSTVVGCHFITVDWNAKVGSQEIPGVTGKFGLGVQNEAGQRLIEFCQENTLVIANTTFQQHKRRLYTWTSPDCQYQNKVDYILHSQRWKSSIQPVKTRPGDDCGSDQNS